MKKLITRTLIAATLVLAAAIGHAQDAKPAAAAPKRAYLIANYDVKDQAMFQKYLDTVNAFAAKYAIKGIVFDAKTRKIEGNPKAVTVIAEFPSMAEAERFWNSAEYTEAKKLRIASTEGFVVMTDGLLSPEK